MLLRDALATGMNSPHSTQENVYLKEPGHIKMKLTLYNQSKFLFPEMILHIYDTHHGDLQKTNSGLSDWKEHHADKEETKYSTVIVLFIRTDLPQLFLRSLFYKPL